MCFTQTDPSYLSLTLEKWSLCEKSWSVLMSCEWWQTQVHEWLAARLVGLGDSLSFYDFRRDRNALNGASFVYLTSEVLFSGYDSRCLVWVSYLFETEVDVELADLNDLEVLSHLNLLSLGGLLGHPLVQSEACEWSIFWITEVLGTSSLSSLVSFLNVLPVSTREQ